MKTSEGEGGGKLTAAQRRILLRIAREAVTAEATGRTDMTPDLPPDDAALTQPGACFVTLEKAGELRGCIGHLEATLPLWMAVQQNARAAASRDPRFDPVSPAELPLLQIEISVLSEPVPLECETPEDVLRKLRPGVDGVILEVNGRRATFLPQVWRKVSSVQEFLDHLAWKACGRMEAWQSPDAQYWIYHVESFAEDPGVAT